MARKAAGKTRSTKKKASAGARKGSRSRAGGSSRGRVDAQGKHLVIVESPTKAKTINKYLGQDYVVMASVGHVRDLPPRNPKGVKDPVPGVDLDHDFEPTYELLPDKKKTVADLRKAAKQAADIWFATDLDREGEAIAWHLAQSLDHPLDEAKRVVFNAITRSEIESAFANPRSIDDNKVNAQQARRILDRIVGYQVSPLLWKKVAGGLSAGRVQSVAVRVVVEREREIDAFVPSESWRITALFTTQPDRADQLATAWSDWLDTAPEGKDRTVKDRLEWLHNHQSLMAEFVAFDGKSFQALDGESAISVATGLGFVVDQTTKDENPKGKGPARFLRSYRGHVASAPTYRVSSIETKRTTSRPGAPFITSTLQQAAANRMGFPLQRTMRVAQQLYEGVDIHGAEGQTGLITYMRTDSTHLTGESIDMARSYIGDEWGKQYLPDKANVYKSSNKAAQEAHEAIRPTDVTITPKRVRNELTEDQYKLYRMIWERFLASQMVPAQWDSTTVLIDGDTPKRPRFKATGRTLVFEGFYKAAGLPSSETAILPPLAEQQELGPFQIDPKQQFTSPPPRYTEASLQKKLEEEGIGRPSTYAPIIQTIQDRKYVEPVAPRDRRMRATDLGMVVTDMLVEAFPKVMDVSYTRHMEDELDKVESERHDWRQMLREFYGPFKAKLELAHKNLEHAKAATEPAPHSCGKCGSPTMYRFGRNGRFLSCGRYPDCDYAAPIDREGNPLLPQVTDILCSVCGSGMTRRTGRFGPFLGCENYPKCKGIVKLDSKRGTIVPPKTPPLTTDLSCPRCERPLYLRTSKRGFWLSCSTYPKCRGRLAWSTVEPDRQTSLTKAWGDHERDNPVPHIKTTDGRVVGDGYVPVVAGDEEPAPTETDIGLASTSDAA